MTITTKTIDKTTVAVVSCDRPIITDPQTALDFMMTVQFETDSNLMAICKEAFCADFFDLSTRLAGEVLQKFVNYNIKLAIYGDFSDYKGKAFKDFMYESNNGNHIFFMQSEADAVKKLANA